MDYTLINEFINAWSDNEKMTRPIIVTIGLLMISLIWPKFRRYDRCRNLHVAVCAIWILGVWLVVLKYNLCDWWLALCLMPIVYLVLRWFYFKFEVNKLKKVRKRDLDIAKINLYSKLSNVCVFEWENRKFVIPLLEGLYNIGAFNLLDKELDRYSAYSDNQVYIQLKAVLLAGQGRFQEMDAHLKSALRKTKVNDKYYPLLINNLYTGAQQNSDFVTMDEAFSKMENYVASVQNKDSIIIEILLALFYRYDQKGDEAGMAKVRAILDSRTPKTFEEYLYIKDIELFYNRRHNNRQGIIDYLDEAMIKADEMEPDEESRLIFKLRIIPRFVEFDHRWKQITNEVFKAAEYYLEYSDEVALAYIEMLTSVVSDAFILHRQSLQEDQLFSLMKKVYGLAANRLNSVKTKVFNMEDIFLYRKITFYRTQYLFARIGTFVGDNTENYISQLISCHKKILELCRINGQEMEYIHFLMTYIDEFIAIKSQMHLLPKNEDLKKGIERIKGEEPNIKEKHKELIEKLRMLDYNASVAYPTLWAANLSLSYGEEDEARMLFQKFQEHKIDIRNYTAPTQRMYDHLLKKLSA